MTCALETAHAIFDRLRQLLNVLQQPGVFNGWLAVLVHVLAVLGGKGNQLIGIVDDTFLALRCLNATACLLHLSGFEVAGTSAEGCAVGGIVGPAAALRGNGTKLGKEVYAAGAGDAQGGRCKQYAERKRSQDSLL